ncbi:MAG: eight-cysteine-cluster domain-containing protein [Candidatus Micrarchaeota archaeon]|nr:eight-cysteine-cluster domain-containing protein [Candidatus Micrarchaeota archaeon]
MDKNILYPAISVIVVILVAAGIYIAAGALGGNKPDGENTGTGINASELYFRAIEKPIGAGDYIYSYRESYENGYWMDVTVSKKGDLQYVEKRDPAYGRKAYLQPNSTILCIEHLDGGICVSLNGTSRFISYAGDLGRMLYDQEALRQMSEMNRKLYSYGALVFEETSEKTVNGHDCVELKYNIDYSGLTVSQLNDMGLSVNSPLVLRSKQYNYSMCVDPQTYEMYEKQIDFVDLGQYRMIRSETATTTWGTGMDVIVPTQLSSEDDLYGLYANVKQEADEYYACLGQNGSDRCIAEVAIGWKDPALCEETQAEMDFCFLNAGLGAKDPSACEKVSASIKDTCYIEFANKMKDTGFCGLIINATTKQQCLALNMTGTGECGRDADCVRAGCSSQLCVPTSQSDVITTCEYVPEFACLAQTTCGCVDGLCSWRQTPEYLNCLNQTMG